MSETKGAAYQKLHDVTQHVFMISKVRSAFNKAPVRVTLDTSGQHTLKWAGIEMRLADSTHVKLPPGECNLYLFPAAVLEGRPATLVGKNLEAMSELLLALATDPSTADMMLTPDAVGAYPIHALLVANTEQSCKLSMRLFHAEPGLMIQPHATGPFIGENCLHVVAANSHESELVEMLELAISRLPRDMVEHMLTAQTEGVFFNESPMRFYGGTPLGYACCFCLKRAVAAMLTTELVSLNAPAARCDITGFLPIHAVCANGLKDMYNWLTTGVGKPGEPTLAPAQLATAGLAVAEGRLTALKLSHCTPIQLAAQLGDKSMFLFLLRKQTNILWKWGPVTQYEIDLQGVDSAGDAECDVMEVIGRLDCHEETTEMLLDTFMQGFIHKLFEQKWWRCAASPPPPTAPRGCRRPRPARLACQVRPAAPLRQDRGAPHVPRAARAHRLRPQGGPGRGRRVHGHAAGAVAAARGPRLLGDAHLPPVVAERGRLARHQAEGVDGRDVARLLPGRLPPAGLRFRHHRRRAAPRRQRRPRWADRTPLGAPRLWRRRGERRPARAARRLPRRSG